MAETIAVIGAGVIGGAIARCLIKSPESYRVIATRRRIERLGELESLGVKVTRDNVEAAKQADIVYAIDLQVSKEFRETMTNN